MDTLEQIDAEVIACLKDAVRWLDAINERWAIVDQMPNCCRGRATMRDAIAAWEENHPAA
jgi:hypothetical protein